MAYNVGLEHKTIGGNNNIFDSSMVRWVTGGVTIDADTVVAGADGKKVLKIGQPLGKITATGLYGPYFPAVAGTKASGTTTVDSVVATIEGEKSPAYNGVVIKFATGTEAAAAWDAEDPELVLTLVAATAYGKTELETLIATATSGAPTDVTVGEIKVTIASAKTGTQWAAAEAVTLGGGVADIAAADDGRQTAVVMLGEDDVDFTKGDQVCTAFDMARVLSARLPVTVTAELKAQLPNITFAG